MTLKRPLQNFKTEVTLLAVFAGISLVVYLIFFSVSAEALHSEEAGWRKAREERDLLLKRKKTETEVRQIMALLEDQRNYAEVSNAPVELARKYGLKVPSVTYQKEGVEEAFIRVTFVFSVTGPYEAIRKYISEIENAKALYVIEDMSLGKSSREGNHLELHMKISALIKTAR